MPLIGIAVDQRTDTIYVANGNGATVSVVNGATCNAHNSAGCGQSQPTVATGNCPSAEALDRTTHTLYVTNDCDNTVSVIDTSACNALDSSGCDQSPPTIAVGNSPVPLALNPATGTLYVGNNGDNTVSVVNAATRNAEVTSGCGQSPPTVQVPDSPYGLALDRRANTVYVANSGNEIFSTGIANLTSSVSMIDGAARNAHDSSGCGRPPNAFPVGGFPWGVAVDQATNRVYVTSIVDSDIAEVDAASCNGHKTSGCHPRILPDTTGGWPAYIGLDPASNTIYVPDNVDGAISLLHMPGGFQ